MKYSVLNISILTTFASLILLCSCQRPNSDTGTDKVVTPTPVLVQEISLEEARNSAETVDRKVCFIGIDALTWDVLQPLLDQGELPNIQRLIDNGSRGVFDTADDHLFSPRIWTSMATGKMPDKHGIEFFFINPDQAKSSGKTAGSDLRECLAVWNILSHFNKRILVSNYMVTWPAETIHGKVISDYFYMEQGTYPEGMTMALQHLYFHKTKRKLHDDRIYDRFFPWFTSEGNSGLSKGELIKIDNLAEILVRDEISMDKALQLAKSEPPDLAMLYLRGTDIASHFYWKYSQLPKDDPRLEGLEENIRRFENVIPEVYRWADEYVGRIINTWPKDTNFILVSDHGFKTLFNDLRGYNILKLIGDGKWASYEKNGQWIPIVTETADPIDPVRRFYLIEDRLEDYFATNGGTRESFLSEFKSKLLSLKTRSGIPIFTFVPSEKVEIVNKEALPDLAVRFSSKLQPSDMIVLDDGDVSIEEYIHFLEQSGNHNKKAVIIASGPDVQINIDIEGARTLDITPTLLALFGLPVGSDMDGIPLKDVFVEETWQNNPIQFIDTYEGKIQRHIEEVEEDSRPDIIQELKAIGYIQ